MDAVYVAPIKGTSRNGGMRSRTEFCTVSPVRIHFSIYLELKGWGVICI